MKGGVLFEIVELLGGVGLKSEAREIDHLATPE